MKKWMISGSVLTMVLAASGCGQKVSFEEAKTIALEDAGVAANEAMFIKEKQEKDEYEFEFQTDESIFSYEISAGGKIESKEKEMRPQTQAADTPAPAESAETASSSTEGADASSETSGEAASSDKGTETAPSAPAGTGSTVAESTQAPVNTQGSDGDIGEEKAKQIALEKAGLSENQVQWMKVEKEREDGVLVYEIEFNQGRTEYSYEIVAATGEIVKAETEIDDH